MPTNTKKKLIISAEARQGTAFIRIVSDLSEWSETSASQLRAQVDNFLNQGITKAEVYINCRGGDCFEATEIRNELKRFGADNVRLKVGALAASAATYLVASFYTTANPNSQFMIHQPSLGTYGTIETIEADLQLLKNTKADYKAVYAKKTGKTEDEIEELWAKGDVWLTAQQALDMKLIDAIDSEDELEVTAETRAILKACGAPVIPEETTPTTTQNDKMDKKQLIALLGLDAEATDEQIEAAIKKAKQAVYAQAADTDTAEQKKEKAAKAYVSKALKAKKIDADMVEHFENWHKLDAKGCEAALDAMTPIPQLSAELKGKKLADATIEARTSWTYAKWQEEDPKGLEALHDSHPEDFDKLFNAQYQ